MSWINGFVLLLALPSAAKVHKVLLTQEPARRHRSDDHSPSPSASQPKEIPTETVRAIKSHGRVVANSFALLERQRSEKDGKEENPENDQETKGVRGDYFAYAAGAVLSFALLVMFCAQSQSHMSYGSSRRRHRGTQRPLRTNESEEDSSNSTSESSSAPPNDPNVPHPSDPILAEEQSDAPPSVEGEGNPYLRFVGL